MIIRIITGIVGIAIAAYVIQTGGALFGGFAIALALLAWWEFLRAFEHRGIHGALVLGTIGILLLMGCAWMGNSSEFVAVTMLIAVLIFLQTVLFHPSFSILDACFSVAGMVYIGYPFAHLIMLRNFDEEMMFSTAIGDFTIGTAFVWIMFIGTWASDTFAYFVGSAIGSHRLAPSISPNKTIEGFLGALLGTTAVIAGLGDFLGLSGLLMAILGALIAIFAMLGDLVESVGKRYVGIKDSGSLIPGHGGVWDRFDSVLFTAPLVYYALVLMQIFQKL